MITVTVCVNCEHTILVDWSFEAYVRTSEFPEGQEQVVNLASSEINLSSRSRIAPFFPEYSTLGKQWKRIGGRMKASIEYGVCLQCS
ncbi:hypothetical protein SUGI_0854320 [Cryptomeria japonica]|nr:hypothetical protein SUGI_0854320 [Cryptomeria japonica]